MLGLILLVLAAGGATRGSRRWLEFPFFRFQPSELGKVLLVLALSAFIIDRVRRQDRKSTRLNSSHANISYAVFCLKKKKYYANSVSTIPAEKRLPMILTDTSSRTSRTIYTLEVRPLPGSPTCPSNRRSAEYTSVFP